MFTKKLFWVLVIGFWNLVSVDAKERSQKTKNGKWDERNNLNQNMTTDCSLNYKFSTRKLQVQYSLYSTCSFLVSAEFAIQQTICFYYTYFGLIDSRIGTSDKE